jgi:hypothetical protein
MSCIKHDGTWQRLLNPAPVRQQSRSTVGQPVKPVTVTQGRHRFEHSRVGAGGCWVPVVRRPASVRLLLAGLISGCARVLSITPSPGGTTCPRSPARGRQCALVVVFGDHTVRGSSGAPGWGRMARKTPPGQPGAAPLTMTLAGWRRRVIDTGRRGRPHCTSLGPGKALAATGVDRSRGWNSSVFRWHRGTSVRREGRHQAEVEGWVAHDDCGNDRREEDDDQDRERGHPPDSPSRG